MKRVCVIGAGVSGLPSIKSCLEEGLEPICYEQSKYIGGLWRYRDEVEEDSVSVFGNVVQNTSKGFTAYSDYPPPANYPAFLRHSLYYEYLKSYVDHFDLRRVIRFQHKVLEVDKAEDYTATGKWKIMVFDILNNETKTEIFDFVMVCSGHHTYPNMPNFPGQAKFEGRIMHSKEYRHPDPFRGLKVVVVGFGSSAVDIASDISSTTKQTYLSTRRKGWLLPRYVEGKKIIDQVLYPKWILKLYNFLPLALHATRFQRLANNASDHKVCGLLPKHKIISQRPVVNDVLPLHLMNGVVKLKSGIKELKPNGLIFEGESEVTDIDVVLCATGFRPLFPFLKGMENVDLYVDKMFRFVFPAHLERSTIAFIGLVDPNVSTALCCELQSRWVARVFSGKLNLPGRQEMMIKGREYQEKISKVCYEGFSQRTNLNGPPYLEEIAGNLGVRPNLLKLMITDTKLFLAVFFGPLCGYHYRIHGPHSWSGAREAILKLKCHSFGAVTQKKNENGNGNIKLVVIGALCLTGMASVYRIGLQ